MDPRPYHFEFRKPRLSNPTLQFLFLFLFSQSNNLYDSMYQMNRILSKNQQTNRYKNVQNKKPLSEPDQVKRNNSLDLQKPQKLQMIRYPSKYQISTSKQKVQLPQTQRVRSKLSNYGYNLMKAEPIQTQKKNLRLDQTQIFQKQQHAFDIINYKPTQYRARLKMFPKLTLQDKINQRYGSPLKQNL